MRHFPFPFSPVLSQVDDMVTHLLSLVGEYEFHSFAMGIVLPEAPEQTRELRNPLLSTLRKGFHQQSGAHPEEAAYDLRFRIDFPGQQVGVEIRPLCIEGSYLKFSRSLPQTVHYCFHCKGNGCRECLFTGKQSPTSVQELLDPFFVEACKGTGMKFHGAGREDADVRMLGSGRPFVLELLQPKKRTLDLPALARTIHSVHGTVLEVRNLRAVPFNRIAELKQSRSRKKYFAWVHAEREISDVVLQTLPREEIEIRQHTPQRVLVRRADMERRRKATILSWERAGKTDFRVTLLADPGLYIKEFISSDDSRTSPSLSSLTGIPCTCTELDVMEIQKPD